MQSTLNNIIDKDQPIIFNKCIIDTNPSITYNYSTGHFTINSNGIYYIRWWANIHTCNDSDYVSLSIKSCKGAYFKILNIFSIYDLTFSSDIV